jgi:hypothetical protein
MPSIAVTGPGKTRWIPRKSTEMPDSGAVVGSSCIVEKFEELARQDFVINLLAGNAQSSGFPQKPY